MSRAILNLSHGKARDHGAELVAETPKLREIAPPNEADTTKGLETRKRRGKPFQKGNSAASNRGPDLARVGVDLHPEDDDRGRVQRRADSLRIAAVREMCIERNVPALSVRVKAELASWALAVSWSRHHYDRGDSVSGSLLAERASAHLLKAEGFGERTARASSKAQKQLTTGLAAARARVKGGDT